MCSYIPKTHTLLQFIHETKIVYIMGFIAFLIIRLSFYLPCLVCFLFSCINSASYDAKGNQSPYSFDCKLSTWSASLYFSILLLEILGSLMNSDTIATLLLLLGRQLSVVYTLILLFLVFSAMTKNRQTIPAKLLRLFI